MKKMGSPLRDENELVATNKAEMYSLKTNPKRTASETTSVERKKVKMEGAEPCCSAATVENVLEDMEEEIDNALEQPCYKDKLTPTNVKSILRHIIANEYVLTMVRDTMKPTEGGELGEIEPKLTRSKAKEMRKQQCSLPWPVASPAKKVQEVSKKLLEEEFPDESSGDEDYKPEEECHSEDDATSKASEAGTPRSKRRSLPSSPVSKATEMSEDENALVIALPELDVPLDPSEADKIALRTRSKLCLNDTPLEEIEASFIAPDFTLDMYEAHCVDEVWQGFLSELYKPIDSTGTNDHPDDANDPEYKAVEDEIPDYEDLRYEQVTTDEWNDLMLGTYEIAQADLSFLDDEDGEGEPIVEVEFPKSTPVIWMTPDEKLELDEQMRMYVQLLTQSHLLSHGNSALENLKVSTKTLLEEMHMFATRERASAERSFFYAQNLDGALDIVKKFEDINLPVDLGSKKQSKKHLPDVPNHIKQTLASSKVFIYPELLPTCGFRNVITLWKYFTAPEDNLVALGLEQFEGLVDPLKHIHEYLIPNKSIDQIRCRIKNSKVNGKPKTNSIKFYLKFKKAPKFQRLIRIFDPENIKAPEDYTPNFLPKWMESFSKFSTSVPVTSSTLPDPSKTTSSKAPPFRKALKPRKFTPILPRGLVYFSPLRYTNPILKKYSKRKPRAPSICDSESPYRPPPLKPKPRPSKSNSDCLDSDKTKKPSICDSELPRNPRPLKHQPRISNSNSECSNITETSTLYSESSYKPPASKPTPRSYNSNSECSDITETSTCDSELSYKPSASKLKPRLSDSIPECSDIIETSTFDSESSYKPPASKPKPRLPDSIPECSNSKELPSLLRRSKRHAAQKSVWAALSRRESSAGVKSSKGKNTETKVCDEMDKETCDFEEDYVSTREKRQCAKQKMKYSAGSKSSTGKPVTTKVGDEVDKRTCNDKEELPTSVIQTLSRMRKKQKVRKKIAKKKIECFAGCKSTKWKIVATKVGDEMNKSTDAEESTSSAAGFTFSNAKIKKTNCAEEDLDNEEESKAFIVQTVSIIGKKQPSKKLNTFSAGARYSKGKIATAKVCDEVDKRTCDNEEELVDSATKGVSTRGKRQCAKKKRNQSHRDLETSLAILQPEMVKEVPMKEEQEVMCANSYLLRATEILKNDSEVYEKLLSTLCKYHVSAGSPIEAKACGRYKDHVALSKVRTFFRKLEIHFKDQPEQISQILRTYAQLRDQVDLISSEVISTLQPLLKNQPQLFNELKDILL